MGLLEQCTPYNGGHALYNSILHVVLDQVTVPLTLHCILCCARVQVCQPQPCCHQISDLYLIQGLSQI